MGTKDEPIEVAASDLKNGWHEYLDQVSRGRREVIVTRYGHPVAKLTPYEAPENAERIFGCLSGTVTVRGDLVASIDADWEADA